MGIFRVDVENWFDLLSPPLATDVQMLHHVGSSAAHVHGRLSDRTGRNGENGDHEGHGQGKKKQRKPSKTQ